MSDVLVTPVYIPPQPDSGDPMRFGPNAWLAPRLFSGGVDGEILVRSAASATGAAWSAASSGLPTSVAVGSVLASNGVGVAPVWSATPAVTGVSLPTPGTPFSLHTGAATFNGTRDDVCYWAYNLLMGSTGSKVTAGEPQLKFGMEANYYTGAVNLMELNLDYGSIDGLVARRPVSYNINRATHVGEWNFASSKFSLSNVDATHEYLLITGAAASNKFHFRKGSSQSGNLFEVTDFAGSSVIVGISSVGQLLAPNGGNSTPTYSFNTGGNSGIYWDGSAVNLSVNSSRKFFCDANGVGVSGKLDMDGWWSATPDAAGGVGFGSGHVVAWKSTSTNAGVTGDIGLARAAAGVLAITNATTGGGALDFTEVTAPAAGATNHARLYAEDSAGKTKLMVKFATGTAVQLAIEP